LKYKRQPESPGKTQDSPKQRHSRAGGNLGWDGGNARISSPISNPKQDSRLRGGSVADLRKLSALEVYAAKAAAMLIVKTPRNPSILKHSGNTKQGSPQNRFFRFL